MFTQKHYEFIAEVLGKSDSLPDAILKFKDMLKQDNPQFKEKLFIKRILDVSESLPPTRAEVLYPSYPQGYVTKY